MLEGGAGDDWLRGGEGADKIYGGAAPVGETTPLTPRRWIDTASYVGAVGVTVDLSDGEGEGGQAEGDTLFGIENVEGTKQADEITGDGEDNVLTGNAGDDTLEGGAGDDTLIGGAGADVLDGGSGGETDGDTASYAGSKMGVMVDLDTGEGKGGDAEGDELDNIENVIGSDHDDTLYGDAGDEGLDGGKGDDMLRGGAGADTLTGGAGTDTVNYYDSKNAVMVDLSSAVAQTGGNGDSVGDILTTIENVQGSDEDDTITGNSLADDEY